MSTTKISEDIRQKVLTIKTEQNQAIQERAEVIHGIWVARIAQQHVIVFGPGGCLAAGTQIQVVRGGNSNKMPIERVVARFGSKQLYDDGIRTSSNYEWDPKIPTYVQRASDGYGRLALLDGAWCSGVKKTFTLTTNTGRSIRATAEHPFMISDGSFKKLSELSVGDAVCVNIGKNKKGRTVKPHYRKRTTKYHPNQVWDGPKNKYVVPLHRLTYEATCLNNLSLDVFIDILRHDEAKAQTLKYLLPDSHVHHVDHNSLNNEPSNLQLLTAAEHHKLHAREGKTESVLDIIGTETVASIVEFGEEMTYDLSVYNDPHNFTANGFVVHNTGKSLMMRDTVNRIKDAVRFEVALDEQSVPDQVFGPTDIKGMVERGRARRVTAGMLPEATDAFIDEIMNAGSTVKHSLQPIMNERLFHNGDEIIHCPLRQLVGGTNHNSADTDPLLAPFFDRFHIRFTVGYLKQRESRFEMITNAIVRIASGGRADTKGIAEPTQVSLEELDKAHDEALALDIEDETMALIDDIWEELRNKGLVISDRRYVEGYMAVLANSWLNGHETVQPGDLDILSHMWWSLQDQAAEARGIILGVSNPGEKAALDLLDELDKMKAEFKSITNSDMDDKRKRSAGIEIVSNLERLVKEANDHIVDSRAAGASTQKLDEVIGRSEVFKGELTKSLFGIDVSTLVSR